MVGALMLWFEGLFLNYGVLGSLGPNDTRLGSRALGLGLFGFRV